MLGLGLKKRFGTLRNELRLGWHNRMRRPNLFDLSSPERVGAIYHQPSDMCETDRIMLYALARGLRPVHALEIGSRWGGSARIITNAMEENGVGRLVGIDPETTAFRARKKDLHHRFTLVEGYSPEAIPRALEAVDSDAFDFVFIDALHTHDAARDDFLGVLPHLSPGAHILFHDAYHQGIDQAITDIVAAHDELFDLGFVTRNPSIGEPVAYQGLRLVRQGDVDGRELIASAYRHADRAPPVFHAALRNYDQFANRIGKGISEDERKTLSAFGIGS